MANVHISNAVRGQMIVAIKQMVTVKPELREMMHDIREAVMCGSVIDSKLWDMFVDECDYSLDQHSPLWDSINAIEGSVN